MGNKHVHHHHPPPPSLEERRKNTKAKLEDIRRHHEAALAEILREQQLLNERLKEEAEINQENQRRALEISQAAASEREARRQEHLRALRAERQTILQEIKDVDAQLKACRDQLTNANKDVFQLRKKVNLEEQNVREQDQVLRQELQSTIDSLNDTSKRLSASQSDALGVSALTAPSQRAFLELQFLLHSLPRQGHDAKSKLAQVSMALRHLLSTTLEDHLKLMEDLAAQPTYLAVEGKGLSNMLGGVSEKVKDVIVQDNLTAQDLEWLLSDEEAQEEMFEGKLPKRDQIKLRRALQKLKSRSDEALKQLAELMGNYGISIEAFAAWKDKAREASKRLSATRQQELRAICV